jgi:HK97 family phage portal protein
MGLIRSIRDAFAVPPGPPPMFAPDRVRSFVTGPGVVQPGSMYWGNDGDSYAPSEYGEYVAKSSVVYAATKMRATLLASLPLKIYRGTGENRKEVTSGPIRDLLDGVNPWWSWDRLAQMTELSLCLWGKNFWVVERGGRTGTPKNLWWARPDRMRVVPDPTNYVSHFLYRPTNGSKDIRFEPNEVIWTRFPNPLDEFEGLSPLSAVRLSADTAIAAVESNRLIFSNGIQAGGFFAPKAGQTLTTDQAKQLTEQMDRRFRGVDKAHRWGVFTFDVDAKTIAMSPKDAEFLGALAWTKEDVALAFGVPLDLIGGQRTYANVEASERIVWTHTVKPEADFIASELTEQLLPMFGTTDLVAEFDYSDVAALSENADAIWTRAKDAWINGGITLNQYMEIIDQEPVTGILGDARILPRGSALIDADGNLIATASGTGDVSALGAPAKPTPQVTDGKAGDGTTTDAAGNGQAGDAGKADGKDAGAKPKGVADDGAPGGPRARRQRTVAFGSDEHRTLMARADERRSPWEARFAETTADLMRRQRQSILKQLRDTERGHHRLATKDLLESILSLPRWIREFRTAIRPVIAGAVDDVGRQSLDDLGLGISFDLADPNVKVAMERQAQRFANEVNATTWDRLRSSLADGLDAGEGIDELAKRVEAVMGDRVAGSAETIARTEALTAASTGTIESWRQSGVVAGKTWLSTLDDRTREAHAEAHGQTVGIDEDFEVGGDTGPGPGMMGSPENDCSCRCSMTAVLDTEMPKRSRNGNGRVKLIDLAKVVGVMG